MKAKPTPWWAPPVDHLSQSLAQHGMPRTLVGFVRRVSGWSQFWVSCLAIAVFVLTTAPLEMQRRILNAAVLDGDLTRVLVLAVIYAGIVLTEGLVKLLMNIYRGWIGEKAVRVLRLAASALVDSMPEQRARAGIQGVEISLILPEPEPIGAFVGVVVSEFVMQAGTLLSAFAYMFYMQPVLAFTCLAIFSPQFVFVPVMQAAINRRVQSRINVLRQASVGVLVSGAGEARSRKSAQARAAFRGNLLAEPRRREAEILDAFPDEPHAQFRQGDRSRRRRLVRDQRRNGGRNRGRVRLRSQQRA